MSREPALFAVMYHDGTEWRAALRTKSKEEALDAARRLKGTDGVKIVGVQAGYRKSDGSGYEWQKVPFEPTEGRPPFVVQGLKPQWVDLGRAATREEAERIVRASEDLGLDALRIWNDQTQSLVSDDHEPDAETSEIDASPEHPDHGNKPFLIGGAILALAAVILAVIVYRGNLSDVSELKSPEETPASIAARHDDPPHVSAEPPSPPRLSGEDAAAACHKLAVKNAKDLFVQAMLLKPIQYREESGKIVVLYAVGGKKDRCPSEAKVVCSLENGQVSNPVGPDFTGSFVVC